jgi:hypothetical protein
MEPAVQETTPAVAEAAQSVPSAEVVPNPAEETAAPATGEESEETTTGES